MNKSTHPTLVSASSLPFPASWVGIGILGAVFFLALPLVAKACDACNIGFADEIATSRAGTLVARDLERAAENQRGLKLGDLVSPVMAERSGQRTSTGSTRKAADETAGEAGSDADSAVPSCCASGSGDCGEEAKATPEEPTPVADISEVRHLLADVAGGGAIPQVIGNRGGWELPDYFEGDPFIEIIERDYSLPTRPTSYVPQDAPVDKSFTIELNEGRTYLGNGVIYDGFLMDGKIPGPTIIVNEGDVVEMNIVNTGIIPHGASIHAAYTQTSKYVGRIGVGETKSVRFRATHPGVFMYHCAPGGHAIPMHVIGGQYGMIVVKPTEQRYRMEEELGREPDIELYLIQHEIYASGKDSIEGNPIYTTFNGRLFRYVEEPIMARPGDYVRIYFLNVGPNLLSTFHLVGIIWDYAYWQGYPENIMTGGQTVTAGPSDSFVIEFRIPPDEGAYTMLSHAVGSTSRGAIGLIVADAEAERDSLVLADGPVFTDEEMEENEAGATRVISPFGIGTHPVDAPVVYGPEVEEVHVSIIGNSYHPKVIQIAPGTTVTWTNEEAFTYLAGEYSGVHNVAATSHPEESEGFVSHLMVHGEQFSHTFEFEGTYDYMCTPHPYMQARVIVKAPAGVAGPGGVATSIGGWALPLLALALLFSSVALIVAWSRACRCR